MPPHAVAGHLVVIVAPLTAILALVHTLRPATRRALRAVWSTHGSWPA
ncbi:hypothetical protein [Cellulomonas biazotea]|nr:hypothetical protein [Cellulomonas biazotea]